MLNRNLDFQVDHTKLMPGIYMVRADYIGNGGCVTTYDLRFTRPNHDPVIEPKVLHTIEHIGTAYLRRNPRWKHKFIYFGPKGCRTGFTLILNGWYLPNCDEIVNLVLGICNAVLDARSIPGATAEECGNWTEHDISGAIGCAFRYKLNLIEHPCFKYPKLEMK